ncbi:glutathionylspermidine synthase family protein [soil metagenome]
MIREEFTVRADWREQMEALGFHFHTIDGTYWDESHAYRFTAAQIDQLDDAVNALQAMCLQVVEHVVEQRLYDRFAIPAALVPMVEHSWEAFKAGNAAARTVIGRFDISWDGRQPPKLLEYNADTPTSLLEASVAQWQWLQSVRPDADQFNSIHERLIAAFKDLRSASHVQLLHFTGCLEQDEERGNLEYLRDCAMQAGWSTHEFDIAAMGWDGAGFIDDRDQRLELAFKLYPWEWLARESFGQYLPAATTLWIEPVWKMILSNKAVLPLLWELFPGHPNLLPAFFTQDAALGSEWIRKPLLSREGENVILQLNDRRIETPGPYGDEGFVYQAAAPLPRFAGPGGDAEYVCCGCWVIGGESAGMGLRVDATPISQNTSRFSPHYFT